MVQAAGGIFSGAGKRLRVGLAGWKKSMLHVIDGDRAQRCRRCHLHADATSAMLSWACRAAGPRHCPHCCCGKLAAV